MRRARFVKMISIAAMAIGLSLVAIESAEVTTLGLIPAKGTNQPVPSVMNLLEAAWLQQKDVALVERREIEKILAEHQMTGAALTDPKSRVRFGQFVPADLLVFVDSVPNLPKPATRIQVSESKSGIVLASQIVENEILLKNPQAAIDLVRTAIQKRSVPVSERHLLGCLDFRGEESGPMLDGIAAALGMLVMTDLARAPQIIVLERDHLQHLQTERNLTTLEQDLRASVRLLEGGVRRGVESNQLTVTVALRPLAGGEPLLVKLNVPANDVIAAERLIAEKVAGSLQTRRAEQTGVDRVTEAEVFDRQSTLWLAWDDRQRSIQAAETALALAPSQARRLHLARMLTEGQTSRPTAIRANELLLEYYHLQANATASGVETNLTLPTVGYLMDLPSPADSAGDRQLRRQLDELEEQVFRFQLAHYRVQYETMPAAYWNAWIERLELLGAYFSGDRQRQKALVREAYDAFLHPPAHPDTMNGDRMAMLHRMLTCGTAPGWWWMGRRLWLRPGDPRTLRPVEYPGLFREVCWPLLREFPSNRDPYVRLIGILGQEQLLSERRENRPGDLQDRVKVHQEILRIVAEEVPATHPYRTAHSAYWGPDCYGEYLVVEPCSHLNLADFEKQVPEDFTRKELDFYVRILRDLIAAGDACRLEVFNAADESHLRWLRHLDEHGRTADALELARGLAAMAKGKPIHDSGIYPQLLERQRLYEQHLHPSAAPAKSEPVRNGPEWDAYEIRQLDLGLRLIQSNLNSVRSSLLMDSAGDRLYCVRPVEDGDVVNLEMTVHSLPTGSMLDRINVATQLPMRADNTSTKSPLPCLLAIARGGDTVYVGTCNGLAAISLKAHQGKLITPAEGLPGRIVRALAWYRGQLYLATGCNPYQTDFDDQAVLAVFDPATRRFAMIASEKAVTSENSWDGTQFHVDDIVPDEASECLWIKDRQTGLWKFTPATRTFENVVRAGRWMAVAGGRYVGSLPSYDNASVWSWGRVTVFAPPDLSAHPTPATLAEYYLVTESIAAVIDGDTMIAAALGGTHVGGHRRFLFLQRPGKDPVLLAVTPDGRPFPGALHLCATAAGIVAVAEDGQAFLLRRKGKEPAVHHRDGAVPH